MEHIWQLVLAIVGGLGGISSAILLFAFYKQSKRIKTNEADKGEIDNLTRIIDQLQIDRDKMQLDNVGMQKEIDSLKRGFRISESEKVGIERELTIYKRAFNSSLECKNENCPVSIKLKELQKK